MTNLELMREDDLPPSHRVQVELELCVAELEATIGALRAEVFRIQASGKVNFDKPANTLRYLAEKFHAVGQWLADPEGAHFPLGGP